MMNRVTPFSLGESAGIGLKPDRHIAGFSIRKEDGAEIPLDLRGGRRQGAGHRGPQAHRRGPPEVGPLVRLRHGSLLQPDRRDGHGRPRLRTHPARRDRRRRARDARGRRFRQATTGHRVNNSPAADQ